VKLLLDDRDSRIQASQGEQRTLTLALRLAAHRAVEQSLGRPPLLLLDDIFSELDPERSAALARSLPAAQTFISTARDEDVPLPAGRRWRLEEGVLG
jgi:DNA replication and repair protein RecF